MATWSLLRASLDFGSFLRITTDGVNVYFRGETTTENVWKYHPDSDTLEQIADASTWEIPGDTSRVLGGDSGTSAFRRLNLCWHNSLYLTVHYDAAEIIRIYRWLGGTSWEVVHTITTPGGANWVEPRIFSTDGNYLALVYYQSGGAAEGFHGLHSNNGSSWSASTGVIQAAITYVNYTVNVQANQKRGIVANVNAGAGQDIYMFDAGTWSLADGTNGYYHFLSDADYHWVLDGSTYKYTQDFDTYFTPDDNYRPMNSFNMPYPSGQHVTGAFYQLYFGDPLPWSEDLAGIGDSEVFPALIRMTDGEVYVMTSTGDVYQRDEPIDPPSGHRLWVYRSTDGGKTWISRGVGAA